MTTASPIRAAMLAFIVSGLAGCTEGDRPTAPRASLATASATRGPFQFTPLATSAACTNGGDPIAPILLPPGYGQQVIASEPAFPDLPDMNTQNETGSQAGRFLYRPHEVVAGGSVTVTDLETGITTLLAQRADWERLDGIVWTPWGTLLTAEEAQVAALRDPRVPGATAGLVYEIDPVTGAEVPRPAIGAKSHEGMRFDAQGNLYSISESNPGYVYRFVPDRRGDLSEGQLYALKVVAPSGDRTGEAIWMPLSRALVPVNADVEAARAGATGYNRPEDVEIATSTGNNRGGANVVYVSITGAGDNRVIGVQLREPRGGREHLTALVFDYVRIGVNAPADFESPDNLALDHAGNLYIAEDPGNAAVTRRGDDIWVATPNRGSNEAPAESVVRFASLTDCEAEPTGIYFETTGDRLFVNVMHRGGDRLDKAMAVLRPQDVSGGSAQ